MDSGKKSFLNNLKIKFFCIFFFSEKINKLIMCADMEEGETGPFSFNILNN